MGGLSKSSGKSFRLTTGSFSEGSEQFRNVAGSFPASYTRLPTVASGSAWDKAVADSDFDIIFRGYTGATQAVVDDYANQFRNGDFYITGFGEYGMGLYGAFSGSKGDSAGTALARDMGEFYSGVPKEGMARPPVSRPYGKLEQLVLKKGTKVAHYDTTFAEYRNTPSERSYENFLIKRGYQAVSSSSSILIGSTAQNRPFSEIVIFDRSAIVVRGR